MMTAVLRDLFWENPMLNEATRVGRRFLRSGGDTGKAVNGVVLALIAFVYLWLLIAIVRWGENMTDVLLMFELTIITLVVPASIYGAVAGERERATWEALILTPLTPAQIIAGKILWRVLIVALIMGFLTLPMVLSQASGKQPIDSAPGFFLRGQAMIFAWGLLLCAFGLWVSANSRRSVTAIAVIAGALLAALILAPMLFGIFDVPLSYVRPGHALDFIGSFCVNLNPFYALGRLNRYGESYHNPGGEDVFGSSALVWLLPVLYLIGGATFLYATHRSLRRLEEPRRRDEG
jgi:ABC-type Na+ efflux pump permease subunit